MSVLGKGEFRFPTGVVEGTLDNIYVFDNTNHCTQKFDANGSCLLDLKYHSVADAEKKQGTVEPIRDLFIGFQGATATLMLVQRKASTILPEAIPSPRLLPLGGLQ